MAFMLQLKKEIVALIKKASKLNLVPCVRLNGTCHDPVVHALGRLQRGAGHHLDFDPAVVAIGQRLELRWRYDEQEPGQQKRYEAHAQHPHTVIVQPRPEAAHHEF